MSNIGDRLITEARSHIGQPFRHHFKPENLCLDGTITTDSCMERGMDPTGYDCSGLVIASMCRVLDMPVHQWPRALRHAGQLQQYANEKDFEPGDVQFYYYEDGGVHLGISTMPDICVHASGKTRLVEESMAADGAPPIAQRALAAEHLREIALTELAWRP